MCAPAMCARLRLVRPFFATSLLNFNADLAPPCISFYCTQDRAGLIKTLVPGTPDHFLFSALLAEQNGECLACVLCVSYGTIPEKSTSLAVLLAMSFLHNHRASTPQHSITLTPSLIAYMLLLPAGYPSSSDSTLDEWMRSNPHHEYTHIFTNRRKLVRFGSSTDNDKEVIELLKRTLGVSLHHSRPAGGDDDAAADAAAQARDNTPSAVDASAITLDAMVKRALEQAKGQHDVTAYLRQQSGTLEHPLVMAALTSEATGAALVNALRNKGGLPDVDGAVALLVKALGTKWASERGMAEQLYHSVFPGMTLAQLTELARLKPDVKDSHTWGCAMLRRLAPPSTVDFRTDPAALSAYLTSVEGAVSGLSVSYNPVRLAVAYARLKAEQAVHPQHSLNTPSSIVLLDRYLAIPRQSTHWNNAVPGMWEPRHVYEERARSGAIVFLGGRHPLVDCLAIPCPSMAEDEALVRQALSDVFAAGTSDPKTATSSLSPWDKNINAEYLRALMAEARLTRGSAADRDSAQLWMGHLPGGVSSLQSLKDRRLLTFHSACREYFRPDDDVTLHFSFKNVGPSVAVRVFEINTTAWYMEKGCEVPTDVALDGLVPHESLTVQASASDGGSPLAQTDVHLPLPSLSGHRRGVFVVELVAGGTSCRAIIRKGQLRLVERKSIAGHVLTLLDEDNEPLPSARASVWMGGRRYAPEKGSNGGGDVIIIPYAAVSSSKPLIITLDEQAAGAGASSMAVEAADGSAVSLTSPSSSSSWSFSSLVTSFSHEAEDYNLLAAFHVDREALIADNYSASLLVRPRLMLHDSIPAPLAALTNVTLTISSVDSLGASSQRVVRNFRLHADKESVLPFAVPPNVRNVSFTLSGDIEIIVSGAKRTLTASHSVALNGVDNTAATRDLHLRCTSKDGYCLFLLGKTGEPVPGVKLNVTLEHGLATQPYETTLKTDANGRVVLGHLSGFTRITAAGYSASGSPNSSGHAIFDLPQDVNTYATSVHTTSAEAVQARFPFRPSSPSSAFSSYRLSRSDVSLIEVRPQPCGAQSAAQGGSAQGATVVVADHFAACSYDASSGFIVVKGLQAGEYQLIVKRPSPGCLEPGPVVKIKVLPGGQSTRLRAGYLTSGNTLLQAHGTNASGSTVLATPLSISSVGVEGDSLTVKVAGGSSGGAAATGSDVRVHVLVTSLVPPWHVGSALSSLPVPGLSSLQFSPVRSRYLNGRTLGEEQQYILDRHNLLTAGKVHAGNSLPRPQLLLSPWSLGTVSSDVQEARSGDSFARHMESDAMHMQMAQSYRGRGGAFGSPGGSEHASYVNLDFLRRPACLLANLRPAGDSAGTVRVPVAELLGDSDVSSGKDVYVTVVAVDSLNTASTSTPIHLGGGLFSSSAAPSLGPVRDLTQSRPQLDADSHVLQQSRITVLSRPGDSCVVSATGTRVETYGSLDRACSLLSALCGNQLLTAEFSWLLTWPRLSAADKRAKYSKYACHEVSLFLFFRDAAFFEAVVAPYLACKRAKTFVDHWLLGHDLSAYLAPHAYQALDACERALLAAHAGSAEAAEAIARGMRDWTEVNPLSRERKEAIFNAALASSALDDKEASDDEVKALVKQAEQQQQQQRRLGRAAAPPPPAPAPAGVAMQYGAVPGMANGGGMMAKRKMMGGPPMAAARMAMAAPMAASASFAPSAPMAMMMSAAPMAMAAPAPMMMMDESMAPSPSYAEESAQLDEDDMVRRESARQQIVFRQVDKTEEYAEAHYYRVALEDDVSGLVPVNDYWGDLAAYMAGIRAAVTSAASPAERRAVIQAALSAKPFVSSHFAESTGNINQVLLTLATLGLPWEGDENRPPQQPTAALSDASGGGLRFTARGTPAVLFHRDLTSVPGIGASTNGGSSEDGVSSSGSARVLVGQSYFDPSDRYEHVRGMRVDKYLPSDAEMVPGRVYGCCLVLTNVTPSQMALDTLINIPYGALPVCNGAVTKTHSETVGAFSTTRVEYSFYFPSPGSYLHYPAQVACEGVLVAHASPVTLKANVRPVRRDTHSWAYLAQAQGKEAEVLAYLRTANSANTSLDLILWRCRGNKGFWTSLTALLRQRQWFHEGVWAYAFEHGDVSALREYMARPSAVQRLRGQLIGLQPVLTSPLLRIQGEAGVGARSDDTVPDIDPSLLRSWMGPSGDSGAAYEHMEYSPLVNARAHQLGTSRRIMNKAVERQYRTLLHVLCAKPAKEVSPSDLLAVTYHLLLQDRVDEALRMFALVTPPAGSVAASVNTASASRSSSAASSSWSTLQYDYTAAYLDFYRTDGQPFPIAAAVAAHYASYPVPKWAARFREVATQLAEAGVALPGSADAAAAKREAGAAVGSGQSGAETGLTSELSREAQQSRGASLEPTLELALEPGTAVVTYSNLTSVTLRFYRVDLELLFSTSPFLSGKGDDGGNNRPMPLKSSGGGSDALGQFAFVRPTESMTVSLPAPSAVGATGTHSIALPAALATANVMVEVLGTGTGLRRSSPYFSNRMHVTFTEPLGRLRVTSADAEIGAPGNRPLPRTYVKVYWRGSEGDKGRFFKDGYTDVRGVFDYASLSTDELSKAQRLAVLVVSESHGAMVREVVPPKA